MNCRDYARDKYMRNINGYNCLNNSHLNSKGGKFHEDRNYNSFSPFLDYKIECYKCNNFGHKTCSCRSLLESSLKQNVPIMHE